VQEKQGGDYWKPSWLTSSEGRVRRNRKRSPKEVDSPPYACWADHERRGYWQPIEYSDGFKLLGPMVLYPLARITQTPLDVFTVLDIMRNTLGVGPCEHLLDLEGVKSQSKGTATCQVRDFLEDIYSKNQQKQKHAEIDKILDDGLIFVTHIRGRIARYLAFANAMRAYLAEQRKSHPEVSGFLAELDKLVEEIETRVAARTSLMKTPADVARMNKDFRRNVMDDEGPDAMKKCAEYTKALVDIGSNQDELVLECRWVVKTVRQRAALQMALDPKVAVIAKEIRARTQETLRGPAWHERPDK
jgi:hypothetical protein